MLQGYIMRNNFLAKYYADKKLTVNPKVVREVLKSTSIKFVYDPRILYSERMGKVTMNEMDLFSLGGVTAVQVIILYVLERVSD